MNATAKKTNVEAEETMKRLTKLALQLTKKEEAKATSEPVNINRVGKAIVLPENMTTEQAIKVLEKKAKEDETLVNVHEEMTCLPLEGAYALMCVLKQMCGWATAVPTPGFFGPNPPTLVDLEVDYGVRAQVIWGSFAVPGIDGRLQTGATRSKGKFVFAIQGEVKQKHKDLVKDIAEACRQWLKQNSIYRGKAVRLKTDSDGRMQGSSAPEFMDLSKVRPDELILSRDVLEQVDTNIFVPIEHTEECRKNKIPLKRGVLLEGPYGTGKTLTANVTAKKCVDNGWTFLYLDKARALKDAILFAKDYAPAVIFSEDIDSVLSEDEKARSDNTNDILNNIDGIDSKGQELMVILTTNNVELIEKAMLRPGRLDAIISVLPPDAEAVEKLIRLYGRDLLDPASDLTAVCEELAGEIPAVIREAVERSKMSAIRRLSGSFRTLQITGDDLIIAARSMKNHTRLMRVVKPEVTEPGQLFLEAVADKVEDVVRKIKKEEDEE